MRRLLPIAAIAVAVVLLVVAVRHHNAHKPKHEDPAVVFAYTTFEAMAKGDAKVHDKIAWDRFNDKGRDVGAEWRATSGEARTKFEQDFLTAFAAPFKAYPKGAYFPGWKKLSSAKGRTVVQADLGPTAKIYFFVVANGWRHPLFAGWDLSPR